MKEECSRKITFLNFILSVLIILLHSYDIIKVDGFDLIHKKMGGARLIYDFSSKIGQLAVPTYFSLSGYLFFRNLTSYKSLKIKLKKRLRSLAIPLIFWNCFFYVIYNALNNISWIRDKINFELPIFSLKILLTGNTINPPMWFLATLIILHLTSVMGFTLFRSGSKKTIILIFAIAILDRIICYGYKNPLHWAFVYYMGAYMAYFYKDEIESGLFVNSLSLIAKSFAILICTILSFFKVWIFAPLLVWILMSLIPDVKVRPIMRQSFFVICVHYFGVRVVRKIITIILGINKIAMLANFLLTIIIVFFLTSLFGLILKKIMPRFYGIVCGGR